MSIFDGLKAPFPVESIHWRVGSTNQEKTKGIALAYLDARDVMDRLDDICGPENWGNRYPHAGDKTICDIGIKVDGEWVWKSDGAGDTQFEADKGAMSDAFKRAAVRWGIGRYLYGLGNEWVKIEPAGKSYKIASSEYANLRKKLVGGVHPGDESGADDFGQVTKIKAEIKTLVDHVKASRTTDELMTLKAQYEFTPKGGKSLMDRAQHFPATKSWHDRVCEVFASRGAELATTNAG